MTWEAVATEHIGHRCVLDDPRTLRCVDCSRKLLLPREPKTVTVSGPPPYKHTVPEQTASPELIALRKREVEAAVRAAREKRTTATEGESA